MGGQVRWIDPHALEVEGVAEGTGKGEVEIIPDRNDAATFLVAGALGGGPVTLQQVRPDHLLPLLDVFRQMNVSLHIDDSPVSSSVTVTGDHVHSVDLQITSRPFPGFSSDWGAFFQVALTQLPGTHLFHETVFARRFAHVPELIRMGAHIEPLALSVDETRYNFDADLIAPPAHAIRVTGATPLHGTAVHANDVRAGAALVLAGLVAERQTVATGVEQIERGYEAFPGVFGILVLL